MFGSYEKKGSLSFTSLHNFEINVAAQRKVAEYCAEENRRAQNDEQGSSTHIIGGDFNCLARGDLPVRISLSNLEIPQQMTFTPHQRHRTLRT